MFEITGKEETTINIFGTKAKAIGVLKALEIPTPKTYLLTGKALLQTNFDRKIEEIIKVFGEQDLIAIRPSFPCNVSSKLPTFLYLGVSDNPNRRPI